LSPSLGAALAVTSIALLGLPARPAAAPTGGEAVVLRTKGPDRILFRSGTSTMGSDEGEIASTLAACRMEPEGAACKEELFVHEYPPHPVYLDAFWLDRTEVTVERYARCVAAGVCLRPPWDAGGQRFSIPTLPATLVTWFDASTYCAWVGGRLPTEAQWERAARGLAGRRYPWGNTWNPRVLNHGRLAWDPLDGRDGFLEVAPVATYPAGRTPEGIDDLAGNVEEWVSDWYEQEYPQAALVNPKGPDTGETRVVRGGGYASGRPWVRGAARDHDRPSNRRADRGFRCAYAAD
jgi:sulfatase modifying factor 1